MTAKTGPCRRRLLALSFAVASLVHPSTSDARPTSAASIQLPGGTLAQMLGELARETNSEIISLDPDIAKIRLPAQQVGADVKKALQAILRDTDYRAVQIATTSYRIERRKKAVRPRLPFQPRRPNRSEPDLIVTASKFPVPLLTYPGSVTQTAMPSPSTPAMRANDMDDIARRMPIVQSTHFGEGRNKFFIRGIADSSFNGATQPTASIYFGDALLGFGNPSPNLKLYDVESVEILEGPQGTLYGSGSIGGVVRITPKPVDVERPGASGAAGFTMTAQGRPGWDTNGTLNIPLLPSRVGLRLVGYHERDGGYIDDARLGRDINSADITGGRASLLVHVDDRLTIDATFLHQATQNADAQYVDGRTPALTRSARIAQPYSNRLSLGRMLIEYALNDALQLTSVTSLGRRDSFDKFDASLSPFPAAFAYRVERESSMVSNETRLSRRQSDGLSWVAGFAYQRGSDGQTRMFGVADNPVAMDEVTNTTYSASVFTQASVTLGDDIEATLGARLATARIDSEPARGGDVAFIRGATTRHIDPTIAIAWRAASQTSVYARLQTSYRNGGVSVARGVGRVADFASDDVIMGEVGIRHLREGANGLSFSGAISYTLWTDIQADLITERGLPYAANIGDAKVLAIEGVADWILLPGLKLGTSFLYTDNRLSGSLAGQSAPDDQRLPNVPRFSGTAQADYAWGEAEKWRFRLGASLRYIGRSVLGPGALLDMSQGDYAVLAMYAGALHGGTDFSLFVDNVADVRGNRFALGNPLAISRREQFVPVRPFTIRAGVGFVW